MVFAPGTFSWGAADAYEAYMGRWSRPVARAFVPWLGVPPNCVWLDVGCGTGALAEVILELGDPIALAGIDPSADFIAAATQHVTDSRASFEVGDACALPMENGRFDVVVAGLVLNHIADPATAAAEMVRVARPGGTVAAYIWDYSGEMQMVRFFWEAVAATDPNAADYDPRSHYHISHPEPLAELFRETGLRDVVVEAIDVPLGFRNFDDYWLPHTLSGPATTQRYVASLDDDRKAALREQLRSTLQPGENGEINLLGRAWAAKGQKPGM
jgi:ubiquinone/menaquinone biosynthesis C-methylase UbiE